MSIGTTLNASVSTPGTTIYSFNKMKDGLFVAQMADGDSNIAPFSLAFTAASLSKANRNIEIRFFYNPSLNDLPGERSLGQMSGKLTVAAKLGSWITEETAKSYLGHIFSALMANDGAVLKQLLLGALE